MEEYKLDRLKYESLISKAEKELQEKYNFFYVVEIEKSKIWFEEKMFKIKNIHTDDFLSFGNIYCIKENIEKLLGNVPFNEYIKIYSYHDTYEPMDEYYSFYDQCVSCKKLENGMYEIYFIFFSKYEKKIIINKESFFNIFKFIYSQIKSLDQELYKTYKNM